MDSSAPFHGQQAVNGIEATRRIVALELATTLIWRFPTIELMADPAVELSRVTLTANPGRLIQFAILGRGRIAYRRS